MLSFYGMKKEIFALAKFFFIRYGLEYNPKAVSRNSEWGSEHSQLSGVQKLLKCL